MLKNTKKIIKKKLYRHVVLYKNPKQRKNTFNKPSSASHPEMHNHVNRDWMMCSQVFIHFSPAVSYASL